MSMLRRREVEHVMPDSTAKLVRSLPYFRLLGRIRLDRSRTSMDGAEDDLASLQKRSLVSDLFPADNYIVARSHSGMCNVFEKDSFAFVTSLSQSQSEKVRCVYKNADGNNIITVFTTREEPNLLRCRFLPINKLRSGEGSGGGTEVLIPPMEDGRLSLIDIDRKKRSSRGFLLLGYIIRGNSEVLRVRDEQFFTLVLASLPVFVQHCNW